MALLNDDHLNTGVWPNLERYVINYINFFFLDNVQSPHNINVCHISSNIQNLMFNISYFLFWNNIL